MNFIIEILPKNENSDVFVFVVRRVDGFPLAVCDTLDSAKDCIKGKFDEMCKQSKSKA